MSHTQPKKATSNFAREDPASREAVMTLNAQGETIPNFYIFKGIRVSRNYLAKCEDGASFGMQRKGWVDSFMFSKGMDHFLSKLTEKGLLPLTNRHLLVLDGHKAHLTLEVVTKVKRNGVDMLTLPSHASHGLQPLDVACFKPFKVAFRTYKNLWTKEHHGMRVTKENLVTWVSLALRKALTPTNIQSGFRGARIWPLNLEAMRGKMGPSEVFKRQTPAEVLCEEQEMNEIMDQGLPLPPTNPTHFFVDSHDAEIELDVEGVEDEDIEVHMEAPRDIATFLRMPQEVIPRANSRAEPRIDYSQNQILTSDGHVDNLHTIQQRKEQLA